MSKFLTGKALEEVIYDIIWDAKETLLIVSPYIKLDDYFKKLFIRHLKSPKLHLFIIFGKNEKDISRSLNEEDIDFFKAFPNVSIVYVPNLHAKYYGNEHKGVITSINLYDYSFVNNIEFGVYDENNLIKKIKGSNDMDAWDKCLEIGTTNELIFAKRPIFKKGFLGSSLGKKYIESKVIYDYTDRFYVLGNKYKRGKDYKTILHFPLELDATILAERPNRKVNNPTKGYCIRTGKEIPFNPTRPFCYEAYKSWAKYENPNYKEKYCHLTGRPSNGKTSFNQPILQ